MTSGRLSSGSLITVLALCWLCASASALTIDPTYTDGAGETWTAVRQGVVDQAVADWEARIGDDETVGVEMTFEHMGAGGPLAYWSVSGSYYTGTDIYPWTEDTEHTITFNVDLFTGSNYLWWDSTPTTDDDIPALGWDALATARHELCHMLGFAEGFYVDNFGEAGQVDRWLDQIVGTTFDPGGLDAPMAAADDLSHLLDGGISAGDLMNPSTGPGVRQQISLLDLAMLELAHGYTIIPEPTAILLLAVGFVALSRRRR